MTRPTPSLIIAIVALCLSCKVAAETPLGALEKCYLDVASRKTNADMAYIARELCDAVHKPKRRSLIVLDTKIQTCAEWWLDPRGRYETEALYCVFAEAGSKRWSLACQDKSHASRYSLSYLRENGERLERDAPVVGFDPGLVFKTLAGCIQHKSGQSPK